MMEFEIFFRDSFPEVFTEHFRQIEESCPCPFDRARNKAIFFMECECNGKYGYLAEAHDDGDMSKSNSVYKIPSSYESALLLPYIMNEGIDKIVVDNVVSLLKRSRRSSGFWNYFFDPEHRSHSLIPDDIDDTALPAVALYLTGNLSIDECRDLARKVINHRLVDPKTNAITTWIPADNRTVIFSRYQEVPKLCAGCLSNLLWFMAICGMDTEPEILPSIHFVGNFIDVLICNKGSGSAELPGMCYYSTKPVMYLFIARLLQQSEYARRKFGDKFANLLAEEFNLFAEQSDSEALDIALMILAVWHLSLHKSEQQKGIKIDVKTSEEIKENVKKLCKHLLTLQDKDGSFRAWVVYRWNKMGHWGGTKATTTGLVLAVLGIAKREIFVKNGYTTK